MVVSEPVSGSRLTKKSTHTEYSRKSARTVIQSPPELSSYLTTMMVLAMLS